MTGTGLERRTILFINEHSTIWPNWPNDWPVFWVLIWTVQLTVSSYHVTYAFQSESTLHSCLKVKELLAWSRRVIWSLSDWNWLSVRLRTKWFWVRVQFESLIVFIFVFPKLFRSFSFSNKCCVSYLAKSQWYFQKIRASSYIKLEPCHLCSNPMKTFETPFFQIVDFSTRTWFI